MSELIDINHININSSSSTRRVEKPFKPSKLIFINEKELERKDIELKTVELISDSLKDICDENEDSQIINSNYEMERPFTTETCPNISIKDYLMHLAKFTKMEQSTLILVLIYIDRICNINKFQLNYRNIYKLILASTYVAIKFNEDSHYALKVYAKIGEISPSELEYLEFHFLILIKFALNVDESLYNKYSETLLKEEDDDDDEDDNEEEAYV